MNQLFEFIKLSNYSDKFFFHQLEFFQIILVDANINLWVHIHILLSSSK